MKISDSKGEYTPAEIKAALAGTDGTRQMSYRYERLDSNNNYIEDIDYIQSCTINYDALADIKRTAKFEILDTSAINYLSDRIKPYVRLTMPGAGTDGRSGYVEWPQGVFILTSPKRSFKEGNYVVREVDGYDMLCLLKDDSVDSPYSVGANVDAVSGLVGLLPYTSARSITLQDSCWSPTNGVGVKVTSATSLTLTQTSTGNPHLSMDTAAIRSGGMSVATKVTPSLVAGAATIIEFIAKSGLGTGPTMTFMQVYVKDNSIVVVEGLSGTKYWTTTYNPTTHAYWKVYESGGRFAFAFSANGVTYTTVYTSQEVFGLYKAFGVNFYVSGGDLTTTSTFTNASIYGQTTVASDLQLTGIGAPTAMEWPTGTSKLRIVNEILATLNYESAHFDEDGVFIAKPYLAPQYRTSEYRYATDNQSVITGDINQNLDLYAIPNKWVISVSDPDRPLLTSSYTNSNPLSPLSTVSRGRTIVDYRTEQNAPDQATLDAQVARLAFEASQVYEVIEFDTGLMPIHQHADVFDIALDGMAVSAKFAEHGWSMDLSNGAVMHHKIRKITTI